jgi:AraC-like DNA-binding protein
LDSVNISAQFLSKPPAFPFQIANTKLWQMRKLIEITSRIKNMTIRRSGGQQIAEPTIAACFAKSFLNFAVARGADRQTLLERSELQCDDLGEPDNRLPFVKYMALIRAAVEVCDEPALALQFGEAIRLSDISILGLVGHMETAEDARRQANRFGRLAVDDGNNEGSHRVELVREDGAVWLEFTGALYRDNPLFTESTFARCVCDGRAFETVHGAKSWPRPKAIRFTYEEPSYRADYDRIFRLPMRFGSNMNGIMFGEELLSVRVAPPNQYVSRLVNEEAEALLGRLDRTTTTRGRVELALLPMLPTGKATVEIIAGKLGLSRQTLFRKLKAEGVTFEKVLDELRHKLALHYLDGKGISVNETAYLVGFSSAGAFSRAFKRWTGSSPRMRHTGNPAADKISNG